jgi:dienelactone hydrolase
MDRRDFMQSAALTAAVTTTGGALAAETNVQLAQARTATSSIAVAAAPAHRGPMTKRWTEQRWQLDNIIQANGMDWDQPRSAYLSGPSGALANADFAAVRASIKKYADAAPAFERQARRREAIAKEAESAGNLITARENYFVAAIHWGAAQWPIDEADEQNLMYNTRKRECYSKYAKIADHKVEEVWIPLGDKKMPAWLHLPYGYASGKVPVVISVPGMDSLKEISVALYGDRFLSRGIAVLAIDGPGQYEAPLVGLYFSVDNWKQTGKICCDYLASRPEIDAEKIGITGNSFGSYFSTIASAYEPRIKATAVSATCLEPGCHTIFEEASPTFKMRFMFMSNVLDETAFDEFRKTITWEGHIDKVAAPYLCLAGEFDELCPLRYTEAMFKVLKAPKQLVVYADSRHSVGGVASANLGPAPAVLVADWMAARLSGKPLTSEKWFVDGTGRVNKTTFA